MHLIGVIRPLIYSHWEKCTLLTPVALYFKLCKQLGIFLQVIKTFLNKHLLINKFIVQGLRK